jgi:hypothetical protein
MGEKLCSSSSLLLRQNVPVTYFWGILALFFHLPHPNILVYNFFRTTKSTCYDLIITNDIILQMASYADKALGEHERVKDISSLTEKLDFTPYKVSMQAFIDNNYCHVKVLLNISLESGSCNIVLKCFL